MAPGQRAPRTRSRDRHPVQRWRPLGGVDAWEYGGWGIRLGKDTAVITRSGPALVVNRSDGAALRVSLDDPDEPVSVMNSLMDRRP